MSRRDVSICVTSAAGRDTSFTRDPLNGDHTVKGAYSMRPPASLICKITLNRGTSTVTNQTPKASAPTAIAIIATRFRILHDSTKEYLRSTACARRGGVSGEYTLHDGKQKVGRKLFRVHRRGRGDRRGVQLAILCALCELCGWQSSQWPKNR